jgi:vitamin B12 transporter
MKKILAALLVVTSLSAVAEIPEIDIRPIPNTSDITLKTVGRTVITQKQFADQNFTDVNDVLNFVNSVTPIQSGPRGQQTSVFTRGTNSNHTLVLLNGIPINDTSTENGLYDFGPDFLSNITAIEVYTGPSAAHFGPGAIGGAVNLITSIDYENKMTVGTTGSAKDIGGNYYTNVNGWNINVKGGAHNSKTESALAGGSDKDGAQNKSGTINIQKNIDDRWSFWTSLFGRNTLADMDGHSVSLQEGFNSNNSLYALQFGLNRQDRDSKTFITAHTHAHDREYTAPASEIDNYQSQAYTLRAEHSKSETDRFSWGIGSEYRNDTANFQNRGDYTASVDANYNNTAVFGNMGYAVQPDLIGSLYLRSDRNSVVGTNNNMKVGVLKKDILPKTDLRSTYSQGFRVPSLYELYGADNYGYAGNSNLNAEQSKGIELAVDYKIDTKSMLTLAVFENNITDLIEYSYSDNTYTNTDGRTRQSGMELSYSLLGDDQGVRFFANSLSSKKADGSVQLRRPDNTLGINYQKKMSEEYRFTANYKFFGQHLDINNTDWSNTTMPETHLLDLGIRKNMGGYEIGFNVFNVLDTDYQRPHGFSQQGRSVGFALKRAF